MNNNYMYMNYDPRQHPCKDCQKRHAFCHGHCEEDRIFNENRPKKVIRNTYINDTRKVKDPFHRKGRVIRHGTE